MVIIFILKETNEYIENFKKRYGHFKYAEKGTYFVPNHLIWKTTSDETITNMSRMNKTRCISTHHTVHSLPNIYVGASQSDFSRSKNNLIELH